MSDRPGGLGAKFAVQVFLQWRTFMPNQTGVFVIFYFSFVLISYSIQRNVIWHFFRLKLRVQAWVHLHLSEMLRLMLKLAWHCDAGGQRFLQFQRICLHANWFRGALETNFRLKFWFCPPSLSPIRNSMFILNYIIPLEWCDGFSGYSPFGFYGPAVCTFGSV